MKMRKSVAFAFPTSETAKLLGVPETGGFFIQMSILREDQTFSPGYPHQGQDVFQDPCAPDLISLYNEIEADECYHFKKWHPQWPSKW